MSLQQKSFAAAVLIAAAVVLVLWAGHGKEPVARAAPRDHAPLPEGGPTMTPAASPSNLKRPPLDENLPAKLETATFAVG